MQTPGRQNEPQTPMLPVIERRVSSIENNSILSFQKIESVERGQRRVISRVINQLGVLNKNMNDIRNIIRRDIREKQRYFKEEQKILKKDSDNLNGISTALFFGARRTLATGIGLLGVSQLLEGNTKVGLENIGSAAALLTPEILEIITGAVVNALALKGLLGDGGKGVGATGLLSKLPKKGLFLIAALAASIILPQIANANENADKRRSEVAARTIRGQQVINAPDVSRFRKILDKFDRILSGIKFSKRRKKTEIDKKLLEDPERNDNLAKGREMGRKISNEMNQNNEIVLNQGGDNIETNNELIGFKQDNSQTDNSFNPNFFSEGTLTASADLNFNTSILNENNFTDNDLQSKKFFPSSSALRSKLDIAFNVPENVENKNKINFINLTNDEEESSSEPSFVGESAIASYVNVGTKFESIDLFDVASSYKTYGVFL